MWGILNLMMGDMTFTLHTITTFFALYLAIFFLRWWIIKRGASTMYVYISILLVGIAYKSGVELIARYYFLTDMTHFTEFCHSGLWASRMLLQLVVMVFLAVYITRRERDSRKNFGKEDK